MKQLRFVMAVCVLVLIASAPLHAQAGRNADVLNPNLASDEELAKMPGMNDRLVKTVMNERPFLSMEAFHETVGSKLDDATREALYKQVFVPINLNKARKARAKADAKRTADENAIPGRNSWCF